MSAVARVITEPLGGSPLSRAVQDGRLGGALRSPAPATMDAWRDHITRVQETASPDWLSRVEGALAPAGAAAARLKRVIDGRGVVVTTGQQAALFGGPFYTLAKGLTALGVADAIEERLGVPAAPVFWGATDDADFVEAAIARAAAADGLHELTLDARPPAGTIMAATPLPRGETLALHRRLRALCGSAPHADYLERALAAFSPGRTLGDAYVSLMRALLEPLGVALLDASHESYRQAARPLLVSALDRASDVARAVATNADAIRAAGFEPQVADDRGLSLVFEVSAGVKRRLAVDQAARALRRGTALAPNVLLRPLVERAVLPTVAYVAGPGELAYFVQTNAVAAALGRDPVIGIPRWSATVIEPFVERALRRLGVEWHELADVHGLEKRIAVATLPRDVAEEWKRLRQTLHERVRGVDAAVKRASLMPDAVLEGLERTLEHKLDRGERRLLAAAKRKNDAVRNDITVASAALFPLGHRQERMLNFIPMLARGGDALLQQMRDAAATHARGTLGVATRPEPIPAT